MPQGLRVRVPLCAYFKPGFIPGFLFSKNYPHPPIAQIKTPHGITESQTSLGRSAKFLLRMPQGGINSTLHTFFSPGISGLLLGGKPTPKGMLALLHPRGNKHLSHPGLTSVSTSLKPIKRAITYAPFLPQVLSFISATTRGRLCKMI